MSADSLWPRRNGHGPGARRTAEGGGVRTGGVEAFRSAVRRSRWLVLITALASALAVNLVTHLSEPRYRSTAEVLVSDRDLGAALTGSEPGFTDPLRVIETELSLARSSDLYSRLAARTDGRYGDAAELDDAVDVGAIGSSNVLAFTATQPDAEDARALADAASDEFRAWRADLAAAPIDEAIRQADARLADAPDNADLRQKRDTLGVLRTLSSGNVTLAARADEAVRTRPAPVRDTLLGLSIGLVVGLLVAGGRELLDTSARTEEDVEHLLGVPVLSSITVLPKGTRLAMFGRRRAEFEDQYALLAADIEHRRPRRMGGAAAIAFTSAGPGEGKSSTAANLAVALARGGSRVLLIDFDLRRPAQHEIFGYPLRATGVTQIIGGLNDAHSVRWNCALEGARPVAQASPAGVVIDGTGGGLGVATAEPAGGVLDIVPSGGPMDSGRALRGLQGEVIPHLVAEVRPEYDWILVDTPPATRTLEVTALSAAVDAVVVVARHGHVSRRSLMALERQARSWRAPILGAVITGAPRERGYAYYGSG